MSDKVVKKFVVRAERAIVEHLVYDVEAYSEEEARLQVEHNPLRPRSGAKASEAHDPGREDHQLP